MTIPVIIMCVTLCGLITHSKGLDSLGPVAHYLERDYGASKMKEQWKSVVGYEGLYEVSNIGRVKSLHKCHGNGFKILCQLLNKQGYYCIGLSDASRGLRKTQKVHIMVAQAFIGERPLHQDIDHLNGDTKDNHWGNLEYVTHRQNIIRGKSSALKKSRHSNLLGAYWMKGSKRWRASIGVSGKTKHLGVYDSEEQASEVYHKKLNELQGNHRE